MEHLKIKSQNSKVGIFLPFETVVNFKEKKQKRREHTNTGGAIKVLNPKKCNKNIKHRVFFL